MKYTTEQLIDLLGLSMSDEKVINALESFEMEMPIIDEQYYFDKMVSSYNKDETLSVVFEEPKKTLLNGDAIVASINFYEGFKGALPFQILFSDTYKDIIQKLGRKANFKDPDLKKFRCWILENKNIYLSIGFNSKDLSGIKYMQVTEYDSSNIDSTLIPNEE